MPNANNIYTPAEIEAMKGGETVSKTFKDTGTEVKPVKTSVINCDNDQVSSSGYGSAPRITAPGANTEKISGAKVIIGEKGKPVTQQKVHAPNIQRFNQQAAKRQLEEIVSAEKADKEVKAQSPDKILATLNAIDRRLRRLEKASAKEQKN